MIFYLLPIWLVSSGEKFACARRLSDDYYIIDHKIDVVWQILWGYP